MEEENDEIFLQMMREMLPEETVKFPDLKKLGKIKSDIAKVIPVINSSVENYLEDGEENPIQYSMDSAPLIGTDLVFSVTIPDFGATLAYKDVRGIIDTLSLCEEVSVQPLTNDTTKISFIFPDVYTIV